MWYRSGLPSQLVYPLPYCLDERSASPAMADAGQAHFAQPESDPHLAGQARQSLGLKPKDAIPLRGAIEAASYVTLAEQRRWRERPGWMIVATDVRGLPWFGPPG